MSGIQGPSCAYTTSIQEPFSQTLNALVHHMCNLVHPRGFKVVNGRAAPYPSLRQVSDDLRLKGTVRISTEGAEDNIFGCLDTYACFMAWHDWTHYTLKAPFTLAGEQLAIEDQVRQLKQTFGCDLLGTSDAMDMAGDLMRIMVLGQLEYALKNDDQWPESPRQFVAQGMIDLGYTQFDKFLATKENSRED
mgnify:CR=1 FL=1